MATTAAFSPPSAHAASRGLRFFAPNRVWRCYRGGLLLDRFLGNEHAVDGNLPEEWLASTTAAENGEHAQGPEEGLSRLRDPAEGEPALLRDAVGGDRVPVLCKFLDSAVRLPIQCHPDQAFARAHYGSEHGKTESWLVLATRRIDGVDPYLLIGFTPGTTREAFAEAVRTDDVRALEAMLHRIPVRPGDRYLIPGRVPHAIGPGVLMLEVQEPSDWVVQVERSCAGTALGDRDRWGPLAPATALDCFDYRSEPLEELRERLRLRPTILAHGDGWTRELLEAHARTDAFRIELLRTSVTHRLAPNARPRIAIVTAGSGTVRCGDRTHAVRRGDACTAPAHGAAMDFTPDGNGPLEVHLVTGG